MRASVVRAVVRQMVCGGLAWMEARGGDRRRVRVGGGGGEPSGWHREDIDA